jgi:cytochrome o ubiquinol oxidase subunit 2
MKFTARSSTTNEFNSWVQSVKQSPQVLDAAAYQKILQPSENNPTAFFSNYETNLYSKVIDKYEEPTTGTASGT